VIKYGNTENFTLPIKGIYISTFILFAFILNNSLHFTILLPLYILVLDIYNSLSGRPLFQGHSYLIFYLRRTFMCVSCPHRKMNQKQLICQIAFVRLVVVGSQSNNESKIQSNKLWLFHGLNNILKKKVMARHCFGFVKCCFVRPFKCVLLSLVFADMLGFIGDRVTHPTSTK